MSRNLKRKTEKMVSRLLADTDEMVDTLLATAPSDFPRSAEQLAAFCEQMPVLILRHAQNAMVANGIDADFAASFLATTPHADTMARRFRDRMHQRAPLDAIAIEGHA